MMKAKTIQTSSTQGCAGTKGAGPCRSGLVHKFGTGGRCVTQTLRRAEPIGCGSTNHLRYGTAVGRAALNAQFPKWTSLPPQSNDRDCARTRQSALGPLYRNKYGDRHLREQGSRCASEQKFPQPRVTISSKYEQIRSALYGTTKDHLRGRRAVRHHAFHVEMDTMPSQLQGDVRTGLLAVSAASGRIHD